MRKRELIINNTEETIVLELQGKEKDDGNDYVLFEFYAEYYGYGCLNITLGKYIDLEINLHISDIDNHINTLSNGMHLELIAHDYCNIIVCNEYIETISEIINESRPSKNSYHYEKHINRNRIMIDIFEYDNSVLKNLLDFFTNIKKLWEGEN